MIKFFSLETNLWNKYNRVISSINQFEKEIQNYSDLQIKQRGIQLKQTFNANQNEFNSKKLIESFALVREASRRTLSLRHYDTQLLGGLILNENKIAEMRTGEGKTLVATAPAFFNALNSKGVHIVTVNDYLAQRDAEWMGQIYRFLGLQVGLIQSTMESNQRRKNYNRDITYVTNSELAFDYLKDNLATNLSDLVQRPFSYCIIDEVDSILIDEARTPLIISGPGDVDTEKIIKATEIAKFLCNEKDFEVDRKAKNISLTSDGIFKIQKLLNVETLYSTTDPWINFILNAIRANVLYQKDIHYIVQNKKVVIVDEFTGRIMEGRRWAEGLHNAIESKEKVDTLEGSETIAAITYQNFFRLYPKISGMTGTAKTEELEFEKIYNLCVSVLPTFKPNKRIDLGDSIYVDEISKWKAVAKECKRMFHVGRPVLVGTTTIKNSEILSMLLRDLQIPHELLNAKPENIKREAEIIAQAGCFKSITIATNMAGRGTDVLLGGNPEFQAYKETNSILELIRDNYKFSLTEENEEIIKLVDQIQKNRLRLLEFQDNFLPLLNLINIPNKILNKFEYLIFQLYQIVFKKNKSSCKKEKEKIIKLGGLYVIGTERHESRRIDNQLRGRTGRQGDPGSSRFFLSLNDPLLKIFGGDNIKNVMKALQISDEALESKFLSKALESAQRKVEGFYYDQRKTLNKYDRVLDKHRSIVYNFRQQVLYSPTIRDLLLELGEVFLDDIVLKVQRKKNKGFTFKSIQYLLHALNLSLEKVRLNSTSEDNNNIKAFLYEQFWSIYCIKELNFWFYDLELFRQYEKLVMLKYIDIYWAKHLDNMNFLKDAVSWSGYAQQDPFIQYEEQASKLFNQTFNECRDFILYELLSLEIL